MSASKKDESSSSSSNSCCPSSTFSCITDLGHKPVTITHTSRQLEGREFSEKVLEAGGNRKKCFWFSRDYGQPVFAMHSNNYINSECFIIDEKINVLRIMSTYKLVLFKEYIHVTESEDDNTLVSVKFRDGSDSFAIWIQICAVQNVDPFLTASVMLTNEANDVQLEKHHLRSSVTPTPPSHWLTMKFKAASASGSKSSNWFSFAKMQLDSITFKKWRYVVLFLKCDDDVDTTSYGLFCILPGVTCLKTGSQLYYEPCDSTQRKYILEFENEALCEHVWNYAKLVTPRDYSFNNENLKTDMKSLSLKGRKMHATFEFKRNRRIKTIYSCFQQIRQEIKQIIGSSQKKVQNVIEIPETHITKLFFSHTSWTQRYMNLRSNSSIQRLSKAKMRTEISSSMFLQCKVVKLHIDIVKMLMSERVPAELIAEYREALLRRASAGHNTNRCLRLHCLFH